MSDDSFDGVFTLGMLLLVLVMIGHIHYLFGGICLAVLLLLAWRRWV